MQNIMRDYQKVEIHHRMDRSSALFFSRSIDPETAL